MISNLDRYKADLSKLIDLGSELQNALNYEYRRELFKKAIEKQLGAKAKTYLAKLPTFRTDYQSWYSEAKTIVRQLLPDRLGDFVRHYEKPKPRKDITFENYRIEDVLQGLQVTRGYEVIVDGSAAIPHFVQQLAILKAVEQRFQSSLFDIQQLVQADLFDSELTAARELIKNKFIRSAGALAGVVLERHLQQVCQNHTITVRKKDPSISVLNDAVKESGVIDTPQSRFIQLLGDLRNLCDHNKTSEPTSDQVSELVDGVSKVTKTIF